MGCRLSRLVLVLTAAAAVGSAACSTQTEPPSGTPVPIGSVSGTPANGGPSAGQAKPRLIADDLPPLPLGYDRAVRPVAVVRATYEFAARHPEVMNYIPCFCGCERGGHQGNHDCFIGSRNSAGKVTAWDAHALGCEICLDVARETMQMFNSGATVASIRAAIDRKYAGPGIPQTPTPKPHGGTH